MTIMADDEHEKLGKACKTCGHPAGSHESLGPEDLDEPENGDNCRYEGCLCTEYVE